MKARIASPDFWNQINDAYGQSGGLYKVFCLRDDGAGEPMPVQRLLGTDPEGILYIGMAASFLDRVINLKKSLSPDHISTGHECGVRHKAHERIAHAFPYEQLAVSFVGDENPRDAERLALQQYLSDFGELPPLNRVG